MPPEPLELKIPGCKNLILENLLIDYNGTLAVDGKLLPGVADRLIKLGRHLKIYVVTADTFGTAVAQLQGLPLEVMMIPRKAQAAQKLQILDKLGCRTTITMGNGRNDVKMLEKAVLSAGIIQTEGCYRGITQVADLIYTDIKDALDSLLKPGRLIAALRN